MKASALQDKAHGSLPDLAIALLLAVLIAILLVATDRDIGLTWDEPAYIAASESYVGWLGLLVRSPGTALHAQSIERAWTANHEHPPMDKIWSGLVWSVARLVMDDQTAHRLGNILLSSALVGLVYWAASRREEGDGTTRADRTISGLAAAAALITMPRFFFHAHLAALDVPAATAIFATVCLFWGTRERTDLRTDCLLGLVWGIALGTKINAVVVPIMVGLWMLYFQRQRHLFRRLIVMGLVGTPISLVAWPWLYHETLPRLDEYARWVTVDHWKIGQWYLGRFHMPPPWHFTLVMAFAVVPLTLTLLYLLGIARTAANKRLRPLGGLLVLGALTPMVLLMAAQEVYDNERLFMPTFPFLAALAGLGFGWVAQGLRRATTRIGKARWLPAPVLLAAGALLAPHLVSAGELYPHLLSYYSESIGGLPGATRLRLETTYWCETYAAALPYLNANAKPGQSVWIQPWSHDVMHYYQLHGKLQPGLLISWPQGGSSAFASEGARGYPVSMPEADYVVLQFRESGFDPETVDWVRRHMPSFTVVRQGVPLMAIYARQEQAATSMRNEGM